MYETLACRFLVNFGGTCAFCNIIIYLTTFSVHCRNVNLSHESRDNDFDSILAEMEKEMSMGDIMKELGYGCTVNATQCKEIVSLFLPLTEITISKILGMIARNHTGLEDSRNLYTTFSLALGCSALSDLPSLNSWDVDVLIDTVKQLVSLFSLSACPIPTNFYLPLFFLPCFLDSGT